MGDTTTEYPKLFVGNLPFRTTAQELGLFFKDTVPVKTVNIISRGRRSLGYGFVEVETLAQAQQAVAAFNKKELEGRPINVEIARARDPNAPPKERPPRAAGAGRPPRGGNAGGANAAANGGAASGGAAAGGASRPPRTRRPRAPRSSGSDADGNKAPAAEGDAPQRRRRPQGPRAPAAPRVPYVNSLFVANLPFKVDDKQLKELMSAPEAPAKDARVARRFRRSKGYGFVEYETPAARDAALKLFDEKTVDGRQISVKVARPETAKEVAAAAN